MQAELAQAVRLARGMLRYDLIAWWATDALIADGFERARLRGWLVTPGDTTTGDALMLGVLPNSNDIGVIASVRCDLVAGPSACVVDREFAPRPLTTDEQAMRRAIATAEADPFFVASQSSYNTIVLRAADYGVDAGWIVYVVASTTDADVVPVGCHFRFDISSNGSRVLRRRASHRTIIEERRTEAGAKVEMVMSSAVYDAVPTEFQPYVSGLWQMPLGMVGCDGSLWMIDGLKVEQVSPGADAARCVDPWREK